MSGGSLTRVLQLHLDVLCVVFGEWVDVSAIVRVQVAAKYSFDEKMLASVLRSNTFTFKGTVNVSNDLLVGWLLKNSVKTSCLIFVTWCGEGAPIFDYLTNNGSSVRSVDTRISQSNQLILTIGDHCRHLVKIVAFRVEINWTFSHILRRNPGIQDLWLGARNRDVSGIFNEIRLNKLWRMGVIQCKLNEDVTGLPWSEKAYGDLLERVDLYYTNVRYKDALALVKRSPRLQALGLGAVNWNRENFVEIVAARPAIVHIDISHTSICDEDILTIAQSLISLRSINCQHCILLTNSSLTHLSNNCGSALEVLHTDIRDPGLEETVKCLNEFCTKVVVLHTLCIVCDGTELCTSGGTFSIAAGCVRLQWLLLKDTKITQSSRKFIEVLKPGLVVHEQNAEEYYDVLNLPL